MNSDLLTVKEVAERLRVCQRTVYRMLWRGELGYLRVRKQYRIPQRALEVLFLNLRLEKNNHASQRRANAQKRLKKGEMQGSRNASK